MFHSLPWINTITHKYYAPSKTTVVTMPYSQNFKISGWAMDPQSTNQSQPQIISTIIFYPKH